MGDRTRRVPRLCRWRPVRPVSWVEHRVLLHRRWAALVCRVGWGACRAVEAVGAVSPVVCLDWVAVIRCRRCPLELAGCLGRHRLQG